MDGKEIEDNYIADTYYGKIRGYKTHNGILSFKGIPYAEPPIKGLRFSPPIPIKRWEGILDAKKFGPVAPQPVLRLDPSVEPPEQNEEDCLTLNIWTPALDDKKRTVMFWKERSSTLTAAAPVVKMAVAAAKTIYKLENVCSVIPSGNVMPLARER